MMTHFVELDLLSLLDFIALAYLLAGAMMIGWLIERVHARRPSVSVLMNDYRRDWMRQFITRTPRIFDATVLDGLRQGITFYASACMLALGGGLALLGNAAPLEGLASDLTVAHPSQVLLKIKVIVVLIFVANALLKFVWSHRLFGYCSIMMAAVPNEVADSEALPRALQAAELNITAARNHNRALRSVYFAMGALGWLLGAEALLVTTTVTLWVLWRRELASSSRQTMLRG